MKVVQNLVSLTRPLPQVSLTCSAFDRETYRCVKTWDGVAHRGAPPSACLLLHGDGRGQKAGRSLLILNILLSIITLSVKWIMVLLILLKIIKTVFIITKKKKNKGSLFENLILHSKWFGLISAVLTIQSCYHSKKIFNFLSAVIIDSNY